jgi:putative transposase
MKAAFLSVCWLYLAIVLVLYIRSMKAALGRELALEALLMAVW